MKRGRFIVLEGIDGSGKTTQIEQLASHLRSLGREVVVTAEPTISVSGGLLRDALGGLQKRTACEMAALFVLDRIFHNVSKGGIKELLDNGYDVICDRYYYSSLAYQGSETDFDWVMRMNLDCPEIQRPDLCIFLDVDPDVSLGRIASSRASTEIYEKKELLEKFRARFLSVFDMLKDRENIAIVDASQPRERVAELVFEAVETRLGI